MTTCPACSSKKANAHHVDGVVTCAVCGALYTTRAIYKGDSHQLVLPFFDEANCSGPERYFDLEVLGSQGLERRHGWYNPATKRITQVG